MMFCVFCGHFLTPVDPITSAWERNCKVFGKRFPGPPGEFDSVIVLLSKRFSRCSGELDSFASISMLFSCDVCETSSEGTGWPGQGLEGVPIMSLN